MDQLDPLHPDAPIRASSHDEHGQLARIDRMRAELSIAELVAEAGEAAFEPVELVEFDPERPDDTADGADTPAGKRMPRTVAGATVVAHMRSIMRIGTTLGVHYVEMPGWTTRGRSILSPRFTIQHHTAATRDIDAMLRDGRPGIPGPLCNWAGHNDGTVVAVAAGRANHAGVATVNSDESYGYEQTGPVPIGASGPGAFPSYRQATVHQAATCLHHNWTAARVLLGHKEIARPLGRKVDPMYAMDAFRAAVAKAMHTDSAGPTPTPSEGLVALLAGLDQGDEDRLATAIKRGVAAALTQPGQPNAGETIEVINRNLERIAKGLEALVANTSVPPTAR